MVYASSRGIRRLGVAAALSVAFLSDGAPWIWERLAWIEQRVGLKAERVFRVLDWWDGSKAGNISVG